MKTSAWSIWGQISEEHVPFHWGHYICTETELSRICLDWLWLRSSQDPEFVIWAIPTSEEELLTRTNIRLCPTVHSDQYHALVETGAARSIGEAGR